MKITVRRYDGIILEADPTQFESEEAVIKAFQVQRFPDEEFSAKIEDGERVKYCSFDGEDALLLLAVLCYRGLRDLVFSLNITDCINDDGCYWKFEEEDTKD
ncbi:MAG: hypothetical protein FWF81_02865 [Defluviitaleaceae bacterium]|nr:hypothetical protein [Defluviitaleaceae bacterium]